MGFNTGLITAADVVRDLEAMASERNRDGMERFGINTARALGVGVTTLREYARTHNLKKNHALALDLWETEIHEARILATVVDNPVEVTEEQMESWVQDFDSWDVCDQCCSNLFQRTPFAMQKAFAWSVREPEFIKRAGFTMMAVIAVHHKKADDALFLSFLPIIEREAADERNFVKKAINWALRQIGKRNDFLRAAAIETANNLINHSHPQSKSARWIARDALRELTH